MAAFMQTGNSTTSIWPLWVAAVTVQSGTDCATTSAANLATASSAGAVWVHWASNTTSLTTTASNGAGVWLHWNTGETTAIAVNQPVPMQWRTAAPAPAQPTPEELERRRKADEEWRQKLAEEKKKEAAAKKRAQRLLYMHLDKEQRKTWKKDKRIFVQGQNGGLYRIQRGWAGNVVELDKDGKPVKRFCIHPREYVPDDDNVLAQKLLLQTDEKEFRRIANATALH